VGKARQLEGASKTVPHPETPQPKECVRNCSASTAGEARRLAGLLRPSHWLPSQLHRTTGARREKPVLNRSFRLSNKLRIAAITGAENGGEVVGVALTMRGSLQTVPGTSAAPTDHPGTPLEMQLGAVGGTLDSFPRGFYPQGPESPGFVRRQGCPLNVCRRAISLAIGVDEVTAILCQLCTGLA
jgi:hypothetical protein